MKQNIFRKVSRFVPVLVAAVAVTGCDAHIDVPDTAVRPGHVLCEDGTALSYTEYQRLRGLPVGHHPAGICRQPRYCPRHICGPRGT